MYVRYCLVQLQLLDLRVSSELRALRERRAVRLGGVLQVTGLRSDSQKRAHKSDQGNTHKVPGARAVRVRALVPRIHVDEPAGVVVVVDGALAVASATKAGERDGLTGERASVEGGRPEEVMAGGAGDVFVALRGQHADGTTFVSQAIERGAVLIVAEDAAPAGVTVP